MVYYSIVTVVPTTTDWIDDYVPVANRLTEQYGGRILTGDLWEQIEGCQLNAMDKNAIQIIIEWPNKKAALDFMADKEYAPFLKQRTEGSHSFHYILSGIAE